MSRSAPLDFRLHAKQGFAFQSPATEILYGGSAGGGKSHLMRVASIVWCTEIPGLQVYLFRRIHDDLIKNHVEGPNGYRAVLAPWVESGLAVIVEDQIRFWNGAKIHFCHVKDEKHRFKYQGSEIHVLLVDELTHFSDTVYRFLRNRVRAVGLKIPAKYEGMFPRIICGSNPGNIGHNWVKHCFIDGAEPYELRRMPKREGGMLRQYIPAKLEDNPSMAADDPGYEARLEGIGSEALVRAMRHGDWDIVDGAFFDNFARERHVLRPVQLPSHWLRYRAGDWGSAKPFAWYWAAVASEDFYHTDGVVIPRGAIVIYREWYGIKRDGEGSFVPDVGVKMTAEEVGHGVKQRDGGDKISFSVIDPAAFTADGGPSIAETMMTKCGLSLRRADNKRVSGRGALGGWDQVRARLRGNDDGKPMLFFFSTCVHAIRTIPVLQHDPDRVEDLRTDSEDHAADAIRYACMARPWITATPQPATNKITTRQPTFAEATRDMDRRNERLRY